MPGIKNIIVALAAATSVVAYSGKMTHYSPSVGVGACGHQYSDSDHVVALSISEYGQHDNPNTAPACSKSVNIHYGGKSATAKVADICDGCGSGAIDVSEPVFKTFADLGVGHVQVTWEFV